MCMGMCVWGLVHVYMMHVRIHVETEGQHWASSTLYFETGLLTGLAFAKEARLCGQ